MSTKLTVVAACLVLLPITAQADPEVDVSAEETDEIVVIGRSVATSSARIEVERELLVDTAAALREIPGATEEGVRGR